MSGGAVTSRGEPVRLLGGSLCVPGQSAGAPMAPERGPQGLPEAFLQSLRPLYNILDDQRRGYVHLREIESRWLQRGEEAEQLPRGVLEGLRRAAPASGYLTFERFVLGLRLSLLGAEQGGGPAKVGAAATLLKRPPDPTASAAKVPQSGAPGAETGAGRGGATGNLEKILKPVQSGPLPSKRIGTEANGIQNLAVPLENGSTCTEAPQERRGRGKHRRHTLTSGVDDGLLQQMRGLEKERGILLQGLEVVERARQWYCQQIQGLQEQQWCLGQSDTPGDWPMEGTRTQLSRLCPKVQELNRYLGELLSVLGMPLSLGPAATQSPPSAPSGPPSSVGPQQTISMLKAQNRLLTKEVTDKSGRIAQLEQEKSALIKQLFEARAESLREANQLDSTFI